MACLGTVTGTGPKGPRRKSTRRSRWQQGCIGMQWAAKGAYPPPLTATRQPRYGTRTPRLDGTRHRRKSTPLRRRANRLDGTIRAGPALWGPHTGDRRSETGLCEIGSGELARVRRGHETRAQRRLIGDNCFTAAMMAPPVSCSEQVPLDPMSPMDCADPSVRIGPTGDISRFRAHRQSL